MAAVVEWCRECRDNDDQPTPASFILWGKFIPLEGHGPRCYDHAIKWTDWYMPSMADQWAVFDLRPFMAGVVTVEGD